MNFASLEFAIFMIVVFLPYWVMNHRQQNYFLLVASYVFYAGWDWRFLSLILISTVINYWVGIALQTTQDVKKRRFYFIIALTTSLGILAVFKYFGFFVDSMAVLLELFGFNANLPILSIVLPVGISFYTFQTLSYTIDVYKKEIEPTRHFFDFALYVSFFPQLVAGPIERAKNLLPQVLSPRSLTYDQFSRGTFLILFGLFKKVVIADGIAGTVNAVYGMPDPTALDITLGTYLFALQIYCDFSAYSDIARGIAKLLGFELMTNFNLPYFSVNPREFWQRWHISLSTWLRDYLYIPLGGNRHGERRTQRNLMITMLLGGLWHGAAWNFVLWGFYQGAILSIHRIFTGRQTKKPVSSSRVLSFFIYLLKVAIFFQIICYGWLLFRATSFEQISDFTTTLLFNFSFAQGVSVSLPSISALLGILLLLVLEIFQYVSRTPHFYRKWAMPLRGLLYASLLFLLVAGTNNAPSDFIYFAF